LLFPVKWTQNNWKLKLVGNKFLCRRSLHFKVATKQWKHKRLTCIVVPRIIVIILQVLCIRAAKDKRRPNWTSLKSLTVLQKSRKTRQWVRNLQVLSIDSRIRILHRQYMKASIMISTIGHQRLLKKHLDKSYQPKVEIMVTTIINSKWATTENSTKTSLLEMMNSIEWQQCNSFR